MPQRRGTQGNVEVEVCETGGWVMEHLLRGKGEGRGGELFEGGLGRGAKFGI